MPESIAQWMTHALADRRVTFEELEAFDPLNRIVDLSEEADALLGLWSNANVEWDNDARDLARAALRAAGYDLPKHPTMLVEENVCRPEGQQSTVARLRKSHVRSTDLQFEKFLKVLHPRCGLDVKIAVLDAPLAGGLPAVDEHSEQPVSTSKETPWAHGSHVFSVAVKGSQKLRGIHRTLFKEKDNANWHHEVQAVIDAGAELINMSASTSLKAWAAQIHPHFPDVDVHTLALALAHYPQIPEEKIAGLLAQDHRVSSAALETVIKNLRAKDPLLEVIRENPSVLFVVAAGNEGENLSTGAHGHANDWKRHPLPNLIVVGTAMPDGQRLKDSNFGPAVTLGYRGVDVLAAVAPRAWLDFQRGRHPGPGKYASLTGSSMGAPGVTNALAKARLLCPKLTASELRRLAVLCSPQEQSWQGMSESGGVLDVERLLTSASVLELYDRGYSREQSSELLSIDWDSPAFEIVEQFF